MLLINSQRKSIQKNQPKPFKIKFRINLNCKVSSSACYQTRELLFGKFKKIK